MKAQTESGEIGMVELSYKGMMIGFRGVIRKEAMWRVEETPRKGMLKIDFSDMAEIDGLIDMLIRIREIADGHIGKWETGSIKSDERWRRQERSERILK